MEPTQNGTNIAQQLKEANENLRKSMEKVKQLKQENQYLVQENYRLIRDAVVLNKRLKEVRTCTTNLSRCAGNLDQFLVNIFTEFNPKVSTNTNESAQARSVSIGSAKPASTKSNVPESASKVQIVARSQIQTQIQATTSAHGQVQSQITAQPKPAPTNSQNGTTPSTSETSKTSNKNIRFQSYVHVASNVTGKSKLVQPKPAQPKATQPNLAQPKPKPMLVHSTPNEYSFGQKSTDQNRPDRANAQTPIRSQPIVEHASQSVAKSKPLDKPSAPVESSTRAQVDDVTSVLLIGGKTISLVAKEQSTPKPMRKTPTSSERRMVSEFPSTQMLRINQDVDTNGKSASTGIVAHDSFSFLLICFFSRLRIGRLRTGQLH